VKYFTAPNIALMAAKNHHGPVTAPEFLLSEGIRNVAMIGSALAFLLFLKGVFGIKFSKFTDSRQAQFIVNSSYWSSGMVMFLLVAVGLLTAHNLFMKKELVTLTKMKEMGMRPNFEDSELKDFMGVPRDQEPHEFFHAKFAGGRNLGVSSWLSSGMSSVMTTLKSMFKSAFMSRFAAPDEDVCKPKTDNSSCGAIDECSWCKQYERQEHGAPPIITEMCRPLWNAKSLPSEAFKCSKVTPEDIEEAHKELRDEFANILSMEVYGDEEGCNATNSKHIKENFYGTEEDGVKCRANKKCAWCRPTSLVLMGRKGYPSCHARDNLKQVPAAFMDCDEMYEDEHIYLTTFMYNLGKKLVGFATTSGSEE
jgi:hypothetical protein